MCSVMRLVFVLALAIALSIEAAETRDFNILDQKGLSDAIKGPEIIVASGKLCQLCEHYSTEALLFLKQNETQTEILSILHHECASFAPLKQQVWVTSDSYLGPWVAHFQVSMVDPEKFCESMHLCKKGMKISLPTREGICALCHHVVVEVLVMLKDPNTQLEAIDLLVKTCSKAQNYEQQCKRLVLKYIPLILVKGQKFLETTDVCSTIHACNSGTQASMKAMPLSANL